MIDELRVFISSKMIELKPERELLKKILPTILSGPLRLEGWVFEDDAVASERTIRQQYLEALKECGLYIGLFWNEYSEWTIDEFNHATQWGIPRHIYVKMPGPDKPRDDRLTDFLNRTQQVTYGTTQKWFKTLEELDKGIRQSLTQWIKERLMLRPGSSAAIIYKSSKVLHRDRFLGQEQLLERVSGYLKSQDKVLLQGFGGVGKTALALNLAARWLDNKQGHVLWLRCGKNPTEALLDAIAFPLQKRAELGAAPHLDAKCEIVASALAESEITLVILDDVWNGQALNGILKALPYALPVLITSRHTLPLDGEIERLGNLSPELALQVLESYARQHFTDQTAAAAICQTLSNLPLALEIAGKTMNAKKIPPSEFLERIRQAPHGMTIPHDMIEEGHESVARVIEVSLASVGGNVRSVFMALGAFYASTITPALLDNFLKLAYPERQFDVAEALDILQQNGLADWMTLPDSQQGYYQFHDLSYSYARANTQDDPKWLIEACVRFAREQKDSLEALDVERVHLLGVMESAAQQSAYAQIAPLVKTLVWDSGYFIARGITRSALDICEAVLQASQATDWYSLEERHYLYSRLGRLPVDFFGERERSLRFYEIALELARQLQNPEREAILMITIGRLRFSDSAELKTYFDERIQGQQNDQVRLRMVEHLGIIESRAGHLEAGYSYLREAVTIARRILDQEENQRHIALFADSGLPPV